MGDEFETVETAAKAWIRARMIVRLRPVGVING